MKSNQLWVIYTDEDDHYFTDYDLACEWYDYFYNHLEEAAELEMKTIITSSAPEWTYRNEDDYE